MSCGCLEVIRGTRDDLVTCLLQRRQAKSSPHGRFRVSKRYKRWKAPLNKYYSSLQFGHVCIVPLAKVKVKITLSCPTLCNPMDCISWNSPGQNTGVGSLSLLQGIFPTQGLNPGLPHCRWILYQLSHQGSPRILECVAYPFSDLPDSGIKPWSLALQADSLPTEL